MDILINKPIKISLDTIDIDKHLPSLEFCIQISTQKTGYTTNISYNTWIECDIFDSFISKLKNAETACLYDMDKNFKLQINVEKSKMLWSITSCDLKGNFSKSEGVELLDLSDINLILETFNQYPKWW